MDRCASEHMPRDGEVGRSLPWQPLFPPSHSASVLSNQEEISLLLQTLPPSFPQASKDSIQFVPTTCSGNSSDHPMTSASLPLCGSRWPPHPNGEGCFAAWGPALWPGSPRSPLPDLLYNRATQKQGRHTSWALSSTSFD